MSGDLKLTGTVAKKARKMLKDVCRILENNNIPYTLDAGTLLGVIRENRLLPWDNDMDLAITDEYLNKLLNIKWKFWLKGYRLQIRKNIFSNHHFPAGSVRLVNVFTTKYFIKRDLGLCDIFVKRKYEGNYYWLEGKFEAVLKYAAAQFLEDIIKYKFNNYEYSVPKNYIEYLTHRYGNWKIPVKNYDCTKDDKAIVADPGMNNEPVEANNSELENISNIGKYENIAKKMLKDVCLILNNAGIRYSLDGGTLLGIVRENRLLPWDKNINISVTDNFNNKLKNIRWKLWLKGYTTKMKYSKFDILYFPKGSIKMIKIQKLFLLKNVNLLNLYITKKEGNNCYWTMGTKEHIYKSVPCTYYEEQTKYSFNNFDYTIPEKYEEYLAYRYGDWKKQVTQYDSRFSDRSIIEVTE